MDGPRTIPSPTFALLRDAAERAGITSPEEFDCPNYQAAAETVMAYEDGGDKLFAGIEGPKRGRPQVRRNVYSAIDSERAYQDYLWPGDSGPTAANPLEVGEQLTLAQAYLTKAMEIWAHESKDREADIQLPLTLDVVRKVAGIVVNCMEQHGAPPRKGF